jgi:hypothetical protein
MVERDQMLSRPLMIALSVIVFHKLTDRVTQSSFAEEYHAIQA